MKPFLYLIISLISLFGKAQVNLDSLWKIWNNPNQPDTCRLIAMKLISADVYLFSVPDSAFLLAQMQFDLAKKKGLKKYQALALKTQGSSYYIKGDNSKAIEYYTKSLKIYEEINNKAGISNILNNMANIYSNKGDYVNAIENYTRSLKLSEEVGDRAGVATALSNIGIIYNEQGDTDKALDYYNRSLKISEEIADKQNSINALTNIGALYHDKHDLKTGLEYHLRGLELSKEIGDKNKEVGCLINIGATYNNMGLNEKAMDIFTESLKLSGEIDDKNYEILSLNNIGALYGKLGKYKKSLFYYKKSLAMAIESNYLTEIINGSRNLYETYTRTGKFKEALEMHKLYIQMRDSMLNLENKNAIMQQEMQYTYEKKKALDEKDHEQQIAISIEKEQKQKVISYAASFGLIILLLFSAFVYTRLRISNQQKKIIEEQKYIVVEKQKEILDSITYAKRLQEAILPPEQFVKQHLPESFILYKPKDIVAGDFYWMHILNSESTNNKIQTQSLTLIAAADCTGHGVPGAMVSVVCSNALNRSVNEFGLKDPGRILDKTRELVLETFSKSDKDVKDGMDISLAAIQKSVDSKYTTIQWAGANNPLWYLKNGEMNEITANKQCIGKTDNPLPFTTHTVELNKGDLIYLFTDGYADQFGGPRGKKFMYKAFKEMLVKNSNLNPTDLKLKLDKTFSDWKNDLDQIDDICVIGIKI